MAREQHGSSNETEQGKCARRVVSVDRAGLSIPGYFSGFQSFMLAFLQRE